MANKIQKAYIVLKQKITYDAWRMATEYNTKKIMEKIRLK